MFKFIRLFLSFFLIVLILPFFIFGDISSTSTSFSSNYQNLKFHAGLREEVNTLKITKKSISAAIHEAGHLIATFLSEEVCTAKNANIRSFGNQGGSVLSYCTSKDKNQILWKSARIKLAGYYIEKMILDEEPSLSWEETSDYRGTNTNPGYRQKIEEMTKLYLSEELPNIESLNAELKKRNLNRTLNNTSAKVQIKAAIEEIIIKDLNTFLHNSDIVRLIFLFAEALIITKFFADSKTDELNEEEIKHIQTERTLPERLLQKRIKHSNFNYLYWGIKKYFKIPLLFDEDLANYSKFNNDLKPNINNITNTEKKEKYFKTDLDLALFIFFLVFWFFILIFVLMALFKHREIYWRMQGKKFEK